VGATLGVRFLKKMSLKKADKADTTIKSQKPPVPKRWVILLCAVLFVFESLSGYFLFFFSNKVIRFCS
jgi:hypothetical protein